MDKQKDILYNIILKYATGLTSDLKDRINNSLLFNLSEDNINSSSLNVNDSFYLLLHNLIPTELTNLLYNYIDKKRIRDVALHHHMARPCKNCQKLGTIE